jgi:aminomethyltransferase
VRDVAERYGDARIVQGPHARAIVSATLGIELPPRMRVAVVRVGGRPALACGTGYTGEDGVELLIDPEVAPAVWAELLDAGVVPCGLGARDTLRLEVCFHLHGQDLTPERNPIEAGLGWCCVEPTGFLGSKEVAGRAPRARPRSWPRSRSRAPASRAWATRCSRMARRPASSPPAPSLPRSRSGSDGLRARRPRRAGTEVEIDVRGKRRAARIASKPSTSSDAEGE